MRWLPLILVAVSYLAPVENLVETFEGELIIRSTWSLMLVFSLYLFLSARRFALVLCCEFLSIAYNLLIALGFYMSDVDLSGAYELTMACLVVVELIAVLPGRTRRDRRDNRSDSDNLHGNTSSPYVLSASEKIPVAA